MDSYSVMTLKVFKYGTINLSDKDFRYGFQQKKHFLSLSILSVLKCFVYQDRTESIYHVLSEEREWSIWFHSDSQISFCSPSNNISFFIYNLHPPHKSEQKEL